MILPRLAEFDQVVRLAVLVKHRAASVGLAPDDAGGLSGCPSREYAGEAADGVYFNLPFTRPAVEKQAAHKLTLSPQ